MKRTTPAPGTHRGWKYTGMKTFEVTVQWVETNLFGRIRKHRIEFEFRSRFSIHLFQAMTRKFL